MEIDDPREHLIVALDVPSADQALELVKILKGHAGYFKVGLQLFISAGPSMIEKILEEECKVFLDLKLHDIPNTVSNAVNSAVGLGVSMLTLHTLGGELMLKRAVDAVAEASAKTEAPKLLGVTILTSMDESQVATVGLSSPIDDLVLRLADLADGCGLDGVVCSPQELNRLSKEGFQRIFFVTPGIRPKGSSQDDQVRTNTAAGAILSGSRYLVIGRPIIRAKDPASAAEAIVDEIQRAKIKTE
jgi:orotidine-5'-phosphate decarboxylase